MTAQESCIPRAPECFAANLGGGRVSSLFPAIVSANMILGRGLRDLVNFRSFLRLLSFLYLLSLNEPPSRSTGFIWEVKATQHPHGMLGSKRFWKLSQGTHWRAGQSTWPSFCSPITPASGNHRGTSTWLWRLGAYELDCLPLSQALCCVESMLLSLPGCIHGSQVLWSNISFQEPIN